MKKLFVCLFILVTFLSCTKIKAKAQTDSVVDGEIELMYTRNEKDNENLSYKFDIEATSGSVGLQVRQDINKMVNDEKLDRMSVMTDAKIKLYWDLLCSKYIFGNFQYEQELQSGIDAKTLTGAGVGYRRPLVYPKDENMQYEIWGGIFAASRCGEKWYDETPTVQIAGDIEIKIADIKVPVLLDAEASYQTPLENFHKYTLATDTGLKIDYTKDFFFKVGIDYLHINDPLEGSKKDFHTTYVSLGHEW